MKVHKLILTVSVRWCTLLGALLAGLVLFASPALAAAPHTYCCSLPAPTGGFGFPSAGLAVGPAGEVFVVNQSASVVDVYSSTGVFETEFPVEIPANSADQVAVDDSATSPSKGDVYIGTLTGPVLKYEYDALTKTATKAASITGLTEPLAVAVNSHGDVYVVDAGTGNMNVYGPTGTLITEELVKGIVGPTSVAVDDDPSSAAYEHIYVATETGVHAYDTTGTCLNACAAFGGVTKFTLAITVGPEGSVYLTPSESEFLVLQSNGTLVEKFGSDHPIPEAPGIGVSGTTVFIVSAFGREVAEFTQAAGPTLTITKTGTGKGTVECKVGAGTFGACAPSYTKGEEITIKDTPEAGSEFVSISGTQSASTCTTNPCTFKIEENSEVTVVNNKILKPKFKLIVKESTEGEVVGSEGATGIKCGTGAACEVEVEEGGSVTLTSTAKAGFVFKEWSGEECVAGKAACKFTMPKKAVTQTAVYEVTHAFPLTVFVTGRGEVTGSGITACTEAGGPGCEAQVEGTATLTAKAETGYVFAGWLGCRKATATECKVDVAAASEVTAVFLKEGREGPKGETGPQGPKGETGPKGERGEQGPEGFEGVLGEKGAAGANGAQGPAGPAGTQGPAGPLGPAGPAGPAGKEGPRGKVQIVTCSGKGHKKRCTTKTVSGTVTFTTASSAHAMLSRRGVVYAAGTARSARGRMSLRLLALRGLRPGRYTLTLISGSGAHERIRSESLTLDGATRRR